VPRGGIEADLNAPHLIDESQRVTVANTNINTNQIRRWDGSIPKKLGLINSP